MKKKTKIKTKKATLLRRVKYKIKFPCYKGFWIICRYGLIYGTFISKNEATEDARGLFKEKDISGFVRYYKLVPKKQQPKE